MITLSAIALSLVLSQLQVAGEDNLDGFAACIERVDDLDGDGFEDLAIGDPDPHTESSESGCIWIVSGKKHSVIARLEAPVADKWFGQSVAYLPKSSSSVKGLFVIGSITNYPEYSLQEGSNSKDSGRAYVLKSDGSLVQTLTDENKGRRFGYRVRCVADADGDQQSDFLICASQRIKESVPGAVLLYSGKTLRKILEITGGADNIMYGHNAIVTREVVTGGVRVFACSEGFNFGSRIGSVAIYRIERSGESVTASKLTTIRSRSGEMNFGHALSDLGDLDGDGWPEIAISAPEISSLRAGGEPAGTKHPRGRVLVVSTKKGEVIREMTMSDTSGFFGADVCSTRGSVWGDKAVLLVTSSKRAGSSWGTSFLCAHALDSGAMVERIDLKGEGGMGLVVLRGQSKHECLVTSCCECDPEGLPGTVMISDEGDKTFRTTLHRKDLIATIQKR